jgi:hypothetical protein
MDRIGSGHSALGLTAVPTPPATRTDQDRNQYELRTIDCPIYGRDDARLLGLRGGDHASRNSEHGQIGFLLDICDSDSPESLVAPRRSARTSPIAIGSTANPYSGRIKESSPDAIPTIVYTPRAKHSLRWSVARKMSRTAATVRNVVRISVRRRTASHTRGRKVAHITPAASALPGVVTKVRLDRAIPL